MSRDRYAQCDGTCTTDCGACKGNGRPVSAADRAKAAELAGEHQHEWMNWVRPAVLRDSLGAVVGQAGIALRHLSGTDDPVLPGWWRTCRSCPAEEWSALASERAAVADLRARVLALAEAWTRYPQSPEDRERNRYGAAMQDCGQALRAAVTDTTGGTQ